MKRFTSRAKRNSGVPLALCRSLAVLAILLARSSSAQSVPYQRTFPQSKAIVEKGLKELESSSAGRLPTLEGFSVAGNRPLDQFRQGFYQCTAQVSAAPSGGSIVRVSANISAWYTDPISGKSGYQTLPSNGRLEADFLDRLQDVLSSHGSSPNTTLGTTASNPSASAARSQPNPPQANPSAPQPSAPGVGSKTPVSSPFKLGSSLSLDNMSSLATQKAVIDRHAEEQAKEVKGLEEILRNQAHPANLVAVRKKRRPYWPTRLKTPRSCFLQAPKMNLKFWMQTRIGCTSAFQVFRADGSGDRAWRCPPPTPIHHPHKPRSEANRRMPTPSHSTWRMKRSHPFQGIGYR